MQRDDILKLITTIVQTELDDDSIELTDDSTSDDVLGWDSIAHIGIVVSIEEQCQVKFEPADITSFQNVGDMVTAVQRIRELQ